MKEAASAMATVKRGVLAWIERVVLVAIVLVLVHTLLQDIGDLYRWTWEARKALIYIGVGFDMFFSIEFVMRFFASARRKNVLGYLRDGQGWIDFIVSVPLLVLSSGPEAFSAFNDVPTVATAAGAFGVLKVVKAIRVARVLRLLRLLKIFKHVKHADSRMAQRHITRLSATVILTIVVTLVGFEFASAGFALPNLEDAFETHTVNALQARFSSVDVLDSEELATIAQLRPDVLIIKENGNTIYSRETDVHYRTYYGPSDYTIAPFPAHNLEVYVDILPLLSNKARHDILHFALIIALVLVMVFVYGPHFARTISDPVHIVARGLREKGHSLRVAIPPRFKDDEVYRLAGSYNDVFLPLKDRVEGDTLTEGAASDLTLDDVQKFIDG